MRTAILACALCALLLNLPSLCLADDWAGPSPRIFASEDGDQILKIVPSQPTAAKGTSVASWVQLNQNGDELASARFPLVNTPLRALIPDWRVNAFVTLDTHASVGHEHAVVIYRRGGQVVRELELEDFLTPQELHDHTTLSISSRWWRREATFSFEVPEKKTEQDAGDHKVITVQAQAEEARLFISFSWGKQVRIKLANGEVLPATAAAR